MSARGKWSNTWWYSALMIGGGLGVVLGGLPDNVPSYIIGGIMLVIGVIKFPYAYRWMREGSGASTVQRVDTGDQLRGVPDPVADEEVMVEGSNQSGTSRHGGVSVRTDDDSGDNQL